MKNIFIGLLICLSPVILQAQDFWETVESPSGGYIADYAYNENDGLLYALGQNFLYQSSDDGESWEIIGSGLPLLESFLDLTIDPTNGYLYLSTSFSGVYRSMDDGATWTPVNNGLSGQYLSTIAVSPVDGSVYVTGGAAVYYSIDHGDNWEEGSTGLNGMYISEFAFTSTGKVIAGTYGGGVYITASDSLNWVASNDGLSNLSVFTVAVEPTSDNIFAGTGGDGVFISEDGGLTWSQVLGDSPGKTVQSDHYVDFIRATAGLIVMWGSLGGFVSSDGFSWNPMQTAAVFLTTYVTALIVTAAYIHASPEGKGHFRSADMGATWLYLSVGISAYVCTAMIFHPEMIMLGTDWGLFYTLPAALIWQGNFLGQQFPPFITALLLLTNYQPQLQKTGNSSFATQFPTVFAASSYSGVMRSTDSLQTWETVNNGLNNTSISAMVANDSGHIFISAAGSGIFRSKNGGDNWTAINNGIDNVYVQELFVRENGDIFAGAWQGNCYYSTDNGDNWNSINSGIASYAVSTIAANSNGTLFLGTQGSGMYRFNENDSTWYAINSGLPAALLVSDILIDADDNIYVATTQGVYFSDDNGNSWSDRSSGLPVAAVSQLAMDADGDVYAGTAGGGLARERTSTGLTENTQNTIPSTIKLYPNYPNPFNPTTRISYSLPEETVVHLNIFNTLGQHIKTLVSSPQDAGFHQILWDGTNGSGKQVSGGVYLYQLNVNSKIRTGKMILLK